MHDMTTGGHHHGHEHGHHHDHHHDHGTGHHHHHTTADGQQVEAGTRIEPTAIAPAPPQTKHLWIDASQGASGDMLLAALIDAGADAGSIAAVLELVAPGKLHLQTRTVERGPFAAHKIDVIADEPNPPARHLSDVAEMLHADGVPPFTTGLALAAFSELAEAEAKVHGTTVEDVHFHEVGALDSIGDIVGVAEAIRTLGIAEGSSSVVAVGTGTVNTQHGLLTVPPPAVIELSKGWQVEAGGPADAGELCTPTGMALIRAICSTVGALPPMAVDAVGTGAGTRVRKDRPGVLRVVVGTPQTVAHTPRQVVEVATNVDDLDPRLWPAILERLLEAGAVDAWLSPIIMKKGRPAHTITALTHTEHRDAVADALLAHTSTIGVRISQQWHRRVLERTWRTVTVDGHDVRIKVAGDGEGHPIAQATPEFADVEALAATLGAPQRIALARAEAEAWKQGLHPGAPWPREVDVD